MNGRYPKSPLANQGPVLGALSKRLGLKAVFLFGSGTRSLELARDLDIAVAGNPLTFDRYCQLVAFFENLVHKPVDVVHLESGISPNLILEILRDGVPLWVTPGSYLIDLKDRLQSISCDDLLSIPEEVKVASLKKVQKRLRVA